MTFSVNATVYYVSNSGNDSNSGTSESQPWQTLTKVNGFYFKPGDQILFKRGNTWNGTITVSGSGSSGSPITYGAYGSGEKPKIYGSEVISGWTKHSGNIYKATFSKTVTQIFVSGDRMQNARYPNDDYFFISSVVDAQKFTSSQLDGGINYKGATWLGRTVRFRLIPRTVTSSSSTTLALDSEPLFGLKEDITFFLCNKLEFLDMPGEWYYDVATKTVYLWTKNGDSPANYVVKGSTDDYGFNIRKNDHIAIKDFDIQQFGQTAINTSYCNYINISDNNIQDAGGRGIYSELGTYYTISNNNINGTNQEAISIRAANSVVEENNISDVSVFEELGLTGAGLGMGISVNGDNTKVRYNRIQNIGYSGISITGQNLIIEYNYIDNICTTLIDGGGIYSYTGSDVTKPGIAGTVIRNNIITNGTGSGKSYGSDKNGCNAIYMDHGTRDVIIENNILAWNSIGIMLHESSNINVKGNTVFDAYILLLYAMQYQSNIIKNNIFCTLDRNGTTSWWKDSHQRIVFQTQGAKGIYDYNKYVSHYNSTRIFDSNGDGNFESFPTWQAGTGQDINSSCDISLLSTGVTEKIYINDTKQDKTYSLGSSQFKDIYGNVLTKSFVLKPFTARILIGTNFSDISEVNQSGDVTAPTISVFNVPSSSQSLTIPINGFVASDNVAVTGYMISESPLSPDANDAGWNRSIPTSYTFSEAGTRTLYAWAKDAAGNISSGVSKTVTIEYPSGNENFIGNTDVYNYIAKDNNLRAMPVTFSQNASINSISIYHNGGTGNVLIGVYDDSSGYPSSSLGATQSTTVNSTEGWQTVNLSTPVNVKAGQTVWLAWVFQSNPGVRYTVGSPGRASSQSTWVSGIPSDFGSSNIAEYKYSVYCNFTSESSIVSGTLGNTDIFSWIAKDNNLRAMPVTFSQNASINSISIYHEGGTGNVLLGVYSDKSGVPSSKLGSTQSSIVSASEGWQTINLSTPVNVTEGQTVWLAWIFQSNPGVRYTIGSPGRASSSNTWASGMPSDFGLSNIADYKYSVYCNFTSEGSVVSGSQGNTDIFNWVAKDNNLRAMPVTFSQNASINSISIYHEGGTGNVLLGVYGDRSGSPSSKLGSTQSTVVSTSEGWQTINLSTPVYVTAGQTVWLAWIFQSNPGVRYTIGSPGRASSSNTWGSGIPSDFGSSNIADYKYSVYCNFTSEGSVVSEALGNTDIFNWVAKDNNLRAMPVTFSQSASINSISIYHNGGTGNAILGVYQDNSGAPSSKLGETQSTTISAIEGWQTIELSTPVNVNAGQTVWLAWIFQSNPGVRYTTGSPGRASSQNTWSSGIPSDFGLSNIANYKYSVYCNYSRSALKDASIIENANKSQQQIDLININSETNEVLLETKNIFEFSIYPNPANSYVNIDFDYIPDSETRILIFDNSGRTIENKIIQSTTNQIDVSQYRSGIYFVKAINKGQSTVRKLIVK
ncbi:MAG: T9SS type A sorting domain-containing protein [Draconibacterium sp.]